MKEIWSNSWKKVLIWVCGYVGILAFAVAGGYVIVKSEDEELRRTAKQCFIVTLIFLAIDALVSILTNINVFASSIGYLTFLNWVDFLLLIAKIAVYAVVIVMTLVGAKMETTVRAAVEEEHKKSELAKKAEAEKKPEEQKKPAGRADAENKAGAEMRSE